MAILSLVAKATLAVVGVGSVIAIPTVLSLNAPPSGKETISPEELGLPEDCYVIKTENNNSQKLLICVSSDTVGFNRESYYLWREWDNKARVSEVTKEVGSNQIKVKLWETQESWGSAGKEVIMPVNSREWGDNIMPVDLTDCSFVSHLDEHSKTSRGELSCHFGWGAEEKKIPLTKFGN